MAFVGQLTPERFNNFSRNYDYIYDVFLIDRDGYILFTVAREDDLGINQEQIAQIMQQIS